MQNGPDPIATYQAAVRQEGLNITLKFVTAQVLTYFPIPLLVMRTYLCCS